jgi:histidine triad (HIT) family protein
MDCLFCSIVEKSIPADIVYEDENIVAFRDIAPQAPQHILLIPRQHISTLNDLNADNCQLIGELALSAKKLAGELGFAEDGYRLAMNCNKDGGQTVFHIHMHLLAGRSLEWPPG